MTQTEIRELLALGQASVVTNEDLEKFKGEMKRRINIEKRHKKMVASLEYLRIEISESPIAATIESILKSDADAVA